MTVGTVFEANHTGGEYARGNVTTNTIEGYFSIFKRGMKGVYQHCDEAHLHRYLAEFDFRYNNRTGDRRHAAHRQCARSHRRQATNLPKALSSHPANRVSSGIGGSKWRA